MKIVTSAFHSIMPASPDLGGSDARDQQIGDLMLMLEMTQSLSATGHFVYQPETDEVSLSRWLREKLGLPDAPCSAATIAALIAPASRRKILHMVGTAIGEGAKFTIEAPLELAGGEKAIMKVKGTAVLREDAEGNATIGYIGIVQDVTRERAAAAELLAARDRAEEQVAAHNNLLAVVSHELRTPMTGILGILDQLKRERSPAERQRALSLIEDSAEVLVETLESILHQARLGHDEPANNARAFEPAALLDRVAELFRPLARRKGIGIKVDAPAGLSAIGEPARIQQIIANFTSNAVKFTPAGRITLACIPPETGSERWLFRVSDTGPGIPEHRRDTIFEPFAGTAADSLGRRTGSGLGLSITRTLAEAMGGEVGFDTQPGKGTSFWLTLNLAMIENELAPAISSAEGSLMLVDVTSASTAVLVEACAAEAGVALVRPDAIARQSGDGDLLVVCDQDRLEHLPAETLGKAHRIVIIVRDAADICANGLPDGARLVPSADISQVLPALLAGDSDDPA